MQKWTCHDPPELQYFILNVTAVTSNIRGVFAVVIIIFITLDHNKYFFSLGEIDVSPAVSHQKHPEALFSSLLHTCAGFLVLL